MRKPHVLRDPLTGEAWESKKPLDTHTATLLVKMVKDMLMVRNAMWKCLERGFVPAALRVDFKADYAWVHGIGGQAPFLLTTFCEVFDVTPEQFQKAYIEGDNKFFKNLWAYRGMR